MSETISASPQNPIESLGGHIGYRTKLLWTIQGEMFCTCSDKQEEFTMKVYKCIKLGYVSTPLTAHTAIVFYDSDL